MAYEADSFSRQLANTKTITCPNHPICPWRGPLADYQAHEAVCGKASKAALAAVTQRQDQDRRQVGSELRQLRELMQQTFDRIQAIQQPSLGAIRSRGWQGQPESWDSLPDVLVDPFGTEPKWKQLAVAFVDWARLLGPGQPFPSHRYIHQRQPGLAALLTIRKALDDLDGQGVLLKRHGDYRIVNPDWAG